MTRLLFVEDEPLFQEALAEILRLNDYEVITAQNGAEGIELAHEHLPDLIICDVMMPEVDGYGVLRELRKDSSTATIPFIFLTAKADRSDMRQGMDLGADDYLTKPFRENDLLAVIKTRLEKRAVLEAQQLRTLSRRFVTLQENERRALAQRVHDQITQPLAGLNLTLQGVRQLPLQDLDQELAKLQTMADAIFLQVNAIAEDMWPTILDELGLLPALLYQFDQFSARTHIKVNFFYQGLDRAFSPEVMITVYQVTEEILQNVAHHAQVDKVTVGIWMEKSMLQVEIEDQGVGFDIESMFGTRIASGLIEIRERIAALGGDLKILSSYGTGVRVQASIPCPDIPIETAAADSHALGDFLKLPRLGHSEIAPNSVGSIRVLVLEENAVIRQGLIRLLETEFNVMGEVVERSQILDSVRESQPDVVILGITMSGAGTLDLIQPMLQVRPGVRVLVFSSSPSDIYAYEALRHGAAGYLRNTASVDEIREALLTVSRGDEYWSASLQEETKRRRLESYQGSEPEIDGRNALTMREREILVMVADGYTSKQIAEKLSISPRTAETHRSNLARKLGLRTQAELIHYAIKRGLIQQEH